MTRRQEAQSVIAQIQRANPQAKGETLRKLLSDAYPFGIKENHPYKIWLEEVNKVCGRSKRAKPVMTKEQMQMVFRGVRV